MKKLMTMVMVVLTMISCIAFGGCKPASSACKAIKMEGVVVEQYGFGISQSAPNKVAIVAAMNEVIKELGHTKIANQLTYHTIKAAKETPVEPGFVVPTTFPGTETLLVCTNAEFAPYEYFVGDSIEGLDIDIMKLLAVKLGMKFKVEHSVFDGLPAKIQGVKDGETKVVAAAMTITDEKKENIAFSDPYIVSQQYIVCAEDKTYTKMADLKGLRIGVQRGTTGNTMCSDALKAKDPADPESVDGVLYNSKAEVRPYNSANDAYLALKSGRIDVIVVDEYPAFQLIKN